MATFLFLRKWQGSSGPSSLIFKEGEGGDLPLRNLLILDSPCILFALELTDPIEASKFTTDVARQRSVIGQHLFRDPADSCSAGIFVLLCNS